MKPILEIKNLGKKYRIQGRSQPYLSLRENLFSFLKPGKNKEEFWALRDVNFSVMPGETIGIIGRNGAGKSTLLKILSRITPPTSGSIITRGRTASLLEVGTGFHPELSGRENIFLNGSILGMKKAEINRQFDAILDFAGVEQFIDTPLKHYSSGMQLRLAFAVAAFLQPEILIIDEVLAVGDSEFQKKCMGKMEDVSKSGRTILFVSHDLSAISNLTRKTLYLKSGVVQNFADTTAVITQYLREGQQREHVYTKTLQATDKPQITGVKVNTSLPDNVHVHGAPLSITVDIFNPGRPAAELWLSVHITDMWGKGMVHVTNGGKDFPLAPGQNMNVLTVSFPRLRLYMGTYQVSVYLSGPPNAPVYEQLVDICSFRVEMNGSNHEFGWLPGACAYLEESTWSTNNV